MERLSILDLISKLCSAIRRRGGVDTSFSILEHMRNPRGYYPNTPDERSAWEELTHPDRHDELVSFVDERRRQPSNPYARFLDSLLLKLSLERAARNLRDPGWYGVLVHDQLQTTASTEDFAARSGELTDDWSSSGAGPETIEPILRFMEANPHIDYGVPGPLVHFMERFYGNGYEKRLIESIRRKPTPPTVWMLNRLINGAKDPDDKQELIRTMEQAKRNPDTDQATLRLLDFFLEYQRGTAAKSSP